MELPSRTRAEIGKMTATRAAEGTVHEGWIIFEGRGSRRRKEGSTV